MRGGRRLCEARELLRTLEHFEKSLENLMTILKATKVGENDGNAETDSRLKTHREDYKLYLGRLCAKAKNATKLPPNSGSSHQIREVVSEVQDLDSRKSRR